MQGIRVKLQQHITGQEGELTGNDGEPISQVRFIKCPIKDC
ncbi:hypothetical protein BH18THE2_BH18THE2_10360 [soil metagenome]